MPIVLDTNVISEICRPQPSQAVVAWYRRQDTALLCTTAITVGEVFFGLDVMPHGRRRTQLLQLSRTIFETGLQRRVLPFDDVAAGHYAILRGDKQRRGQSMPALDAQIAAIALAHGATLATRNTADFRESGVAIIDPWLS